MSATREDDERFFERHPDREFRLRRATIDEVSGTPPQGKRAFKIIHRAEINLDSLHTFFGADEWFNCERSDAEIRALLADLHAK